MKVVIKRTKTIIIKREQTAVITENCLSPCPLKEKQNKSYEKHMRRMIKQWKENR